MTQEEAIKESRKFSVQLGNTKLIKKKEKQYEDKCTGNIDTCKNNGGECMICSIRDCPYDEPLHYHHDGCPACYGKEKWYTVSLNLSIYAETEKEAIDRFLKIIYLDAYDGDSISIEEVQDGYL